MPVARRVMVVALLLVLFSCQYDRWRTTFESDSALSGGKVVIEVPGEGFGTRIGIQRPGGNPHFLSEILLRRITRAWVGWSQDGSFFSVLVCAENGGSTIERHSFADVTTAGDTFLGLDFRESDTALAESLRQTFRPALRQGASDQDVLKWFCDGYGEQAFVSRFGPLGARTIRLPPKS